MKIKKIFHTIFALAALSAVFCGCSNFFDKDDDDDSSSEKGRLLFSASSARAASTINPTGFDFSNDSGLTFTLTGTKDGESRSEELGKWSDSDEKKAYARMAADTSILVDTGKWAFCLSVTKNSYEVLYGIILEKKIIAGDNTLDFGELKEASKDDKTRGTSVDVAKGSMSLSLSFPAGKIKSATGLLYAVGSDKSSLTGEALEITNGDKNDSITFSKSDLSAGTYIVEISLYTDEEKSLCTKYTALVVVAPGAESKAERQLDSLNALYTVNYELNGGSFPDGETIQTSYSPVDKITLSTPKKNGYKFAGWSKVGADAIEADYKDGETISISENTTLYALWIPEYTVSYQLNGGSFESDATIQTIYTSTDKFILPTPTKTGGSFVGWSKTSANAIEADYKDGETISISKNTTLYALWKYTVKYELNGGSFSSGTTIQTNYMAMDKFKLPTPTRDYYTFAGWSETSADATYLDYKDGETISISKDTTLYALWNAISYSITYKLNADSDKTVKNSNTGTYTVEDGIKLSDLENGENVFAGWYESEDFSTEKVIGWSAGKKNGNITLYAKWTGVTADNIVAKIKSLTASCSLKPTGKFSTSLIRQINAALKELSSSNSDVLVTLDLSEVTGLTELENASSTASCYSFYGCTNLAGILLPDSLTSIGSEAFYGCKNLKSSITIPSSIKSIGKNAFSGCYIYASVYYEGTLEQWLDISFGGSYANPCYYGADLYIKGNKLTDVEIPDSVTNIANYAFDGCESITSVTIGDSVTNIGDSTFKNCTSLGSVTIGDGVTSIGENAFYKCNALTNLTIGNRVNTIGNSAFYYCESLKSVTIPDSVTSIGNAAFDYCKSLASVTIGENVTSIGNEAFEWCESLTSVIIGDSVVSIGENAFCRASITSITIPVSVKSIGEDAFLGFSKLKEVNYKGTLEQWLGISFNNYSSNPCCQGAYLYTNGRGNLSNVTSIGNYVFSGCENYTAITIPGSVTSIGNGAFAGSKLSSVTIPDSVKSIGDSAFAGCSLSTVTIPNSVTNIGSGAFAGSKLSSVIIPDSVTSIGEDTFNSCTSLKSVVIGTGVKSIAGGAFYGCSSLEEMTIPFVGGSADAKNSSRSTLFGYIFGEKSYDGGACIRQCPNNKGYIEYYIPTTLTKVTVTGGRIFYGAFFGCSALTSVIIGDSVKGIGDEAFYECSALANIEIGDSVASIGENVFYKCSALANVKIGDSVKSIGGNAFSNCSKLTSITIPAAVTKIGKYAFYPCKSLSSVTFNDTTTWSCTNGHSYELDSRKLADTSTAAYYLSNADSQQYSAYLWEKK